jgi:hypothetical protein
VTFVHRLRRLSLTTRSTIANLLIIAALGAWLSAAVHSTVQAEAVAEAKRSGEVAASFVQHTLPDATYMNGLTPADRARLDEIARASPELRSLRIWGLDGEVVYDSDNRIVGTRQKVGRLLAGAYAGRTGGHLETARSEESPDGTEDLLEVYVPLRAGDSGSVVGAVELYLPYDGSAARASAAAARMVVVLAIGLAALWGVLWWLALRVTHGLRRSAEAERDLAHTDELTRLPNRGRSSRRSWRPATAARRWRCSAGPRPVQGGQRHPGPPRRRPPAAPGERAAAGDRGRTGDGGPARRRRVRGAAARASARSRPPASRTAWYARSRTPSRSRTCRSASGRASAWRSHPPMHSHRPSC